MPWKTWREQRQAEQASRRLSGSDVWEACSVLLLIPMFLLGGLVAFIALTVGLDVLAEWIVGLIKPLMGPPAFALIGAALILFPAWAVFRLATGHAAPGTSRRDMIVAVMGMIGVALFGLGFLVAALASGAPDTARF